MWAQNWGELIWGGVVVPLLSPIGMVGCMLVLIVTMVLMQRRQAPRAFYLSMLVAIAFVPLAAIAAPIVLPHSFVNGTPADADEVNANFDALANAINASRVHEVQEFRIFFFGQTTMSLTALCDDQDIVVGGAVVGGNVVLTDEGALRTLGSAGVIGAQGWTATATGTPTQSNLEVNAACLDR